MTPKRVISQANLPTHFPIGMTAIALLVLDRWHAPGWAYGAALALLAIIWIGAGIEIWREEYVDVVGRVKP